MADVKISQLPSGTANAAAIVPATNAAGTTTQKVTLGSIRDLPHAHAAGDVTSGTLDIARVPTGTSSSTVCIGNDARLSDARTPTSHTHGGISNDGKIGTTSGLPVKTGTAGVLEAGAFGTTSGTFCQGDDSRLSDARTPTSHTHDYETDLTNKPTLFDGDYDSLTNTPPVVISDPTGITGADAITNIVSLTQAEYDDIATPDAATLYVITD